MGKWSVGQVQRVMHITSTSLTWKSTSRGLVDMHFFVHWIKMKLFINLKERCKLKNALRVKLVFNSLKGEFWVTGDGRQVIKLQNLCFKFPLKKLSCKDRDIKKKILQGWSIKKKISSTLKILQPPHQKSNGPPLKETFNSIQTGGFGSPPPPLPLVK